MWQTKSRPNATAKIPYAYKADENDPLVLHPDQDAVVLVEEAMDYLDQGILPEEPLLGLVKRWALQFHQGLSNIWKAHGKTSELLKSRKKQRRKMLQKLRLKRRKSSQT